MTERLINYDPIYNVVNRDDFDSLIEVDRYADRTDAFNSASADEGAINCCVLLHRLMQWSPFITTPPVVLLRVLSQPPQSLSV